MLSNHEIERDLNFVLKYASTTSSYFIGEKISTPQKFLLSLLNRMYLTCTGVKVLMQSLYHNPEVEYSIGLTLRTHLLDYLIAQTAYDQYDKNKSTEELEDFCNSVFSDGFRSTLNYLRDLKAVDAISDDKLNESYRNIAEYYQKWLEPYKGDGSPPKIKFSSSLGGKKLFIILAKSSAREHYTWIYDTYLFYSKYEHFSALSEDVATDGFEDKRLRIIQVIGTLFMQNFILHSLLHQIAPNELLGKCEYETGEFVKLNYPKYQ